MAEGGEVKFNALVIGGTGATGKQIVGYLLKHKDKVGKVTVLGRRKLEVRCACLARVYSNSSSPWTRVKYLVSWRVSVELTYTTLIH